MLCLPTTCILFGTCLVSLPPRISPTDLAGEWLVRALDRKTGEPLAGIAVWGTYEYDTLVDVEYALADAVTGADGFARIDLSALANLHPIERETVRLNAVFSGHNVQTDSLSIQLAEVSDRPEEDENGIAEYERDILLDHGSCLTGCVVDDAGRPVALALFEAGIYRAEIDGFEPEVSGSNYQFLTDPKGRFSLDLEIPGAFDFYAFHPDFGARYVSLNEQATFEALRSGLVVELDPGYRVVTSTRDTDPPEYFQFPSGYKGAIHDGGLQPPPRDHIAFTVTAPTGHPIRGASTRYTVLREPHRVGVFERSASFEWLPDPITEASFWLSAIPERASLLVTAEIVTRGGHWWAEEAVRGPLGKGMPHMSLPLQWTTNEKRFADVTFQFVDAHGVPVPHWRGFAESARSGRTLFNHTQRGTLIHGPSHGDEYFETTWEAGPTRLVTHTHEGSFELPVETVLDLPSDGRTDIVVRSPGYGGRLQFRTPEESQFPEGEFLVGFQRADGLARQSSMARVMTQRDRPVHWNVRGATRVHYDREPSLLLPPGDWKFQIKDDGGSSISRGSFTITEYRVTTVEVH